MQTLEYFNDTIFLGDSLIKGFDDNGIDLGNAMVCGYKGMSPDQLVMDIQMEHHERGFEVMGEILKEKQPKKLYILTGTNNMSAVNNEDYFIKYYAKMLDKILEIVPEDCIIYIQSLPPVMEGVASKKPGLKLERLISVNARLYELACEYKLHYIDLWEPLSLDGVYLNSEYAIEDGIHMNEMGYEVWRDYLLSHALI
jgi:lysophospholipase L1-like esterase